METIEIEETRLIGLALETKTTNDKGKSGIDCGRLWQRFEAGKYRDKVQGKLTDEVFAVYHQYESDHTGLFSYFIGYKVKPGTPVPEGLNNLIIPAGKYQKVMARGKMPDCIANTWKEIWVSGMPRAYRPDFEVYDERSKDWNNAEVEIFISVKS